MSYPWHMRPADPRDRAIILRLARAHGVTPRWAGRDLTDRDRIARLERQLAALLSKGAAA